MGLKVFASASSFSSSKAKEELLRHGIELVLNPFRRRLTEDEISDSIGEFDGLLAGLEPLNDKVLAKANKLKAIARIGVGTDNVDFEAARRLGIAVSNTPDGPTEAVAEMTASALLSIIHNIVPSNSDIHNGIWKKRLGKSAGELCVLIIGYGRIGKKTADLLLKLGCKVSVFDPFIKEYSASALVDIVHKYDVISLHASGENEILTRDIISKLKPGCIILNSARGKLVNEEALFEALNSNQVSFFWGDALWTEPYKGLLIGCPNAILTPHIATYTDKCRNDMEYQAVENLLRDMKIGR